MTAGGLKQRLVGALVLICAGVVLWSLLFTGPKVREIDRESQIPTPPEKVVVNVPDPQPRNGEPVNTDLNSEPNVTIPTPTPDTTKNATAATAKNSTAVIPPTPALPEQATTRQDARGIPIAWVVVVGSFADQTKASGIVADLKKRGFKAYIDALNRDGRTLYRVSIGPKLEKFQADKIKQEIDALMKVNASVLKFEMPR
jgi:DedD protein